MKKIFIISMSLLLSLSLAACGKKDQAKAEANEAKVASEVANKETDEEQVATSNFDKEAVNELIKNSDYISRIRISTSTAEGMSTAFLKDYKGDLSQIQVDIPKNLSPNKEYLIFYRDDEKGEVSPTDREGSFIELQGDKDSNLIYIEKQFDPNSYTSSVKSK
ncbi:MAG: hypothetical protein QP753_04905 [Peptoniphilus harei]|uniref:hypothetical protein n=1 Tax=Peptoniphilus TaxID=162289 RepID=UPI0024AE48FA|nr:MULTISPECIES: hypothetical protein [Peptoniphilus]MDK7755493.1 hypothetical protein [Peptoniphilus harei]MDK7761156.1 hypothetical protein [Peptoniphilus harei]MDK8270946.1 hypothetical protein [Peptoniphilus harei]MDK8339524.1 hypothetical protein [Peptoniphilus harei]MDU7532371.1 hypothetical protein [Peptoniphilus harei]